ncbi:MAG TPA: TIR domain-containing protein [Pyrinomonadaceae bacterium]|jgi:hypothetical protein
MEKIEIENLILKQLYDWWERHRGSSVYYIFEQMEGVEEKVFSRIADKLEEDNFIKGIGQSESCDITAYGILEAEERGLIDSKKVNHYENIRFEILKSAAEVYEVEGRNGEAESKKIIQENDFNEDEFHNNLRMIDELNLINSSNGWYFRSTTVGREKFKLLTEANKTNNNSAKKSKAVPSKTIKKLFALSGNKCAFPHCSSLLVDEKSGSIIGEICHIKGKNPGSPRYDETQTDEQRNSFDNLILMCPIHHKIIDDNAETYTAERLQEIKNSLELSPISSAKLNTEQQILEKTLEKHLRLNPDTTIKTEEYDVALSFAGEDRKYVEEVASELKRLGVHVFYDNFEKVNLWGKDLYTHLQNIYQNQAKYTVIFISEHYAKKLWTNHERKMAQARAFTESREYILPARFDNTEIEGILPTTGYVDLRKLSPQEFCILICEKLGVTNSEKVATDINESQFNDEIYPPISLNQTSLYGYITGSSKIRMLDRRLADMYGLPLDTTQDSSLWLLEQAQRLGIENVAELDEAVKANGEIAFNMGRFWRPQEKVNAGFSLSLVFQVLVAQFGSIDKINEFYASLKYTSGAFKDILDNFDQAIMYAAKDTKNATNPYILEKLWTRNGGVNITTSSEMIPDFPNVLIRFRFSGDNKDFWEQPFDCRGSIRLFEGQGWTEIWNFPHTQNHCSYGIFMIRWRSANPDVRIATTVAYSPENATEEKIGKFGYMCGTNCEQPLFKFADTLNGNESNLVDIYYELKFWQAAP